jgi:PAS domain S-box-containing protein
MAHYLKTELYELIKKDDRIFNFIQGTSLDGLWFWDLENPENKWMNPRFWEFLGYDSEKIPQRARAWKNFMNPEDYKMALDDFQKYVTDSNHIYKQEVRYTHRNGSTVWMHSLSLAIRDKNGKPVRMFGTARDITKQKQATQQLEESEEKFRQIFEQSPLAIQLYDKNGVLLEVNQETLHLFGITDKEEIAKINFWDFQDLTPEIRTQLKEKKSITISSSFDFDLAKQHKLINSKHCGIKTLNVFVAPIIKQKEVSGYLVHLVETTAQQKAQKELQDQHDLFETVINTVPARIFWKDLNSTYLGCNIHFAKDAGKKSSAEVIGKCDEDMAWKKHADLYRASDQKIMQSGSAQWNHEEPFIGLNGEEVTWSTSKLPLKNTEGKIFGMVAISEDISAKRIAEKQLKESEQKFRGIFEHANIGIAIADRKGNVLEVNKGYLSITGYSQDEVIGLNYATLTNPDDLEKEVVFVQELTEGKRNAYRIEKRLTCKNGDFVWLDTNVTSIRNSKNEIERLIALVVDVSEKKKATESMNTFFEQPLNLHIISGTDGKILKVNSGCENMLGYKKEELEGSNFLELVHPDDVAATVNEMKALEKGIKTFYFENRYHHKQGHYITLAWSSKVNALGNQLHATAKDITEEKAYHEALLLSEENYKALSENAKHMIITYNFKGEITYLNSYALNLLGLSKKQAMGADINQLLSESDTLKTQNNWNIDFQKENHEVQHFEIPILLSKGEVRYLDVIASPIKIQNKVESILLTAYDITHRKANQVLIKEQNEEYEALNEELLQTNKELLTSIQREEKINERFSFAMQASSEGLWDWDMLTNKVYYSPRWKKMFGYAEEELANDLSVWEKLTHPEDLATTYRMFDELTINKDGRFHIEIRMQHKKGHWLNISSRAKLFFNAEGKAIRVVGTNTDITQKKLSETKLRENEEKLRLAIENSPLGICFTDLKGNIISSNIAFQKMMGYTKKELSQMNLSRITHPDYAHKSSALLNSFSTKNEKEFIIEKKYIDKKGTIIDARVHGGVILDKQNNPMFGMAFIEDISELQKTLNDLQLAKEKAEESNALKTEFLHNMSHEIRTPMNGIMGFSNLLNDMEEQTEEQKSYISIILNSSTQLLHIIDDILEISSLQTKQLSIQEEEFDVNLFIMELFAIYNLKSKERNIPLYVKNGLENGKSLIRSDKAKIHKILSNLLDNAFKFTSSGKIELGYKIEASHLVFFVKDTGIGVSESKQLIIFERFTQGSSQTAQEFGGLGLGLSIAKENTKLLKGEISVASNPDKGSIFLVKIPYQSANKETMSTSKEAKKEHARLVTILVAEDEEVNFLYLEAVLQKIKAFKIKILHVINGEEAVNKCFDSEPIDLVLMDIKMPIMNGYVATEKIKEKLPDLPIIVQTAYSTSLEKDMALKCGCDDFISKPTKKEELLSLVMKHLKDKNNRSQ